MVEPPETEERLIIRLASCVQQAIPIMEKAKMETGDLDIARLQVLASCRTVLAKLRTALAVGTVQP